MKRLETLVREARRELAVEYAWTPIHGVERLDIARAVDAIRNAERTLRLAFDSREREE
jgi:hypothetical protein